MMRQNERTGAVAFRVGRRGRSALMMVVLAGLCVSMAACQAVELDAPWRSSLYPEDWTPDRTDQQGRFLHDFSYAGYAMGERPIPEPAEPDRIVRPSTGEVDDTARIQEALDAVGRAGGGTVMLRAGVYHVAPPDNAAPAALRVEHENVVLRGAGPGRTVIINTETNMRGRQVILVAPPGRAQLHWNRPVGPEIALREDADSRAGRVRLAETSDLRPGDWVVLRQDVTEAFIRDHDMTGLWTTAVPGPTFYRRVTAVHRNGREIDIDIPLRYPLLTRDRARVHRVARHLSNVGIEDLSIGMVQSGQDGFGPREFAVAGTGAHDVHGAHVIRLQHVVDGWVRRVRTVRPEANVDDVHIQSNGIMLMMSRNVTVKECIIQKPQYRGEGGNGYGIVLRGSDCLVTQCRVTHGRHNYLFSSMWTSGNVVHRSRSEHSDIPSDFHMHLSPANLMDNVTVNRDWLEARYRPYGTITHGHTTTESVFWNTRGEAAHPDMRGIIVDSRQFGWGYVIGTQGRVHGVMTRPTRVRGSGDVPGRDTAPEDFVEGVGRGRGLQPESLYEDQLRRRLDRDGHRLVRRLVHEGSTLHDLMLIRPARTNAAVAAPGEYPRDDRRRLHAQ